MISSRPLIVDLDGTLLRSDMLIESAFAYFKAAPLRFYRPLLWLITGGKAALKAKLAESAVVDVTVLPYDNEILSWLKHERDEGRSIVLATASNERYAVEIADHLALFDRTYASDGQVNLSAHRKCQRLVEEYGEKNFDYVGNSSDDLVVWKSAERAYVVNASRGVEQAARSLGNVERVIDSRTSSLKNLLKAIRLHQWLKNTLIFVPLLALHAITDVSHTLSSLLAFLAFGLCASSVYLLNDLLDLNDDRHHPSKRKRPFASGALPLTWGIALCPALLLSSIAISYILLPWRFSVVLAGYYALTLAYSAHLKRLVMVDVVVLAMLYTIRIVAGAVTIHALLSPWLLAFSIFIFQSLALLKRYAELRSIQERGLIASRGRGYVASDLPLISSLGAAAGYLSVLVMALYVQDSRTTLLYHHPKFIWLACPLLLYWISHAWIVAHRGQMHDDPVIFAVRNRASVIVLSICAIVFWVAI